MTGIDTIVVVLRESVRGEASGAADVVLLRLRVHGGTSGAVDAVLLRPRRREECDDLVVLLRLWGRGGAGDISGLEGSM